MKRIFILLLTLFCLSACRTHDDYTGEPCVSMEYKIDGEQVCFEDWGRIINGVLGDSFQPLSFGRGLWQECTPDDTVACFELQLKSLSLKLKSDKKVFVNEKRYLFEVGEEGLKPGNYVYVGSERVWFVNGWFSLQRYSKNPYCCYEVHFEFTGKGANGTFELTDGRIEMGRRFQYIDSRKLIVDEAAQ